MRFLTGLILGFALGLIFALLLAPSRGEETRRRLQVTFVGEEEAEQAAEAMADPLVHVRRGVRALRDQIREAWDEAQVAAQETEEEMLARYQESHRRRPARRVRSR